MKFTVVKLFKQVNMSYQHDGLRNLARYKRVNLQTLLPNEIAVFLNGPMTAIKVYTPDGGLHYYRPGGKLNLEIISKIPHCFNPEGPLDCSGKKSRENRSIGGALSKA